ncbi:hypothetical protein [Nocardia wallacei]|uniref:hypothetical protein n=1 Tax=Nocardia wallacei TaxID=480035 RepID=UPI002457477A|nr:hypothetical protein [Nocardia wallacei]
MVGRSEVRLAVRLREDFADDPSEDGFVLQVADELPDVCTVHALPAVERRQRDIQFRRTDSGWVQETARRQVGWMLRGITGAAAPKVVLEGEWPICRRCVRNSELFRALGSLILMAGVGLLFLLFVSIQLGYRLTGLVIAIFPGWFPFATVVAMLAYIRSKTVIYFEPIGNATDVLVSAHPDFVAAVRARD